MPVTVVHHRQKKLPVLPAAGVIDLHLRDRFAECRHTHHVAADIEQRLVMEHILELLRLAGMGVMAACQTRDLQRACFAAITFAGQKIAVGMLLHIVHADLKCVVLQIVIRIDPAEEFAVDVL